MWVQCHVMLIRFTSILKWETRFYHRVLPKSLNVALMLCQLYDVTSVFTGSNVVPSAWYHFPGFSCLKNLRIQKGNQTRCFGLWDTSTAEMLLMNSWNFMLTRVGELHSLASHSIALMCRKWQVKSGHMQNSVHMTFQRKGKNFCCSHFNLGKQCRGSSSSHSTKVQSQNSPLPFFFKKIIRSCCVVVGKVNQVEGTQPQLLRTHIL